MLQRPTMLRFLAREYRKRETRGFLPGFVRRCYPIFLSLYYKSELLAHFDASHRKYRADIFGQSSGSLVGVCETHSRRFRPIFSAHCTRSKASDLMVVPVVIAATLMSYLTKSLVQILVQSRIVHALRRQIDGSSLEDPTEAVRGNLSKL